ncbi:MAG: cohesin domain-containing protein [Patescibacteria group bacterium]|jgi:hypothetical protein
MVVKKTKSNWLIPILCLVVIFQSVVIATYARKSEPVSEDDPKGIPTVTVEEREQSQLKLSFVPSGISVQKGETVNVDLVLAPKRALRLDGIDMVLAFDSKILEVIKLATHKNFTSVTENREVQKGILNLTFLEEKEEGFLVDRPVRLVTLTIKAKEVGEGTVTLLRQEGFSTVIVENRSSKKLEFDQGLLKIIVNK